MKSGGPAENSGRAPAETVKFRMNPIAFPIKLWNVLSRQRQGKNKPYLSILTGIALFMDGTARGVGAGFRHRFRKGGVRMHHVAELFRPDTQRQFGD